MIKKEIKKNVEDCLNKYRKLKEVFLMFCDLSSEMLSKDNFFEMSTKKVKDGQIDINMLSTTLTLRFLLKKNRGEFLPIGCMNFDRDCENSSSRLWTLYFDEKGDVFETSITKFNSANLLSKEGIESFFYLILDKYMNHSCFEIDDVNYNLNLS